MKINPDTTAIKLLQDSSALDLKHVIAYTMHYCGCTYEQIGEVFGFTRQQAKNVVDSVKASIIK